MVKASELKIGDSVKVIGCESVPEHISYVVAIDGEEVYVDTEKKLPGMGCREEDLDKITNQVIGVNG